MAARASDDILSQRVDDLRDETRAGFADVREEIRAGLSDVRGEPRNGFADVRTDMRALRARLDTMLLALVVGSLGVIATLLVKL
jgi:hypothetical protein